MIDQSTKAAPQQASGDGSRMSVVLGVEWGRFVSDYRDFVLDCDPDQSDDELREKFEDGIAWLMRNAPFSAYRCVRLPDEIVNRLRGDLLSEHDVGRFWTTNRSVAQNWNTQGGNYGDYPVCEDGTDVVISATLAFDQIDVAATIAAQMTAGEKEITLKEGEKIACTAIDVRDVSLDEKNPLHF